MSETPANAARFWQRRRITEPLAGVAVAGIGLAIAWWIQMEPLGVGLWCIVLTIITLPLAFDVMRTNRIVPAAYVAATVALAAGAAYAGGWQAGVVLAAVGSSLIGGASLLVALRLRSDLAIGITIAGALIAFTWPVWAADLLTHVHTEPWLQWVVNVSPAFALNGAIAPDDPLTHRPLAYRLMNLGQDVNYAMPGSVWACAAVHAGIGLAGLALSFVPVRGRRSRRAAGGE